MFLTITQFLGVPSAIHFFVKLTSLESYISMSLQRVVMELGILSIYTHTEFAMINRSVKYFCQHEK